MCDTCSWTFSHVHQELAEKRTRTKGIRELQGVDSGERKKKKHEATHFFTLYNVLLGIFWSKGKPVYNHWDMNDKATP